MKLPLQSEIISPLTVALINLRIYGIISFICPWLIDIKLNTNWICIGNILHLYKTVLCIGHTSFQVLGVRNKRPLLPFNPNEGELVQLHLGIESKVSLPQTPMCKLYLQIDWITKIIGRIPLE